MKLRLKTILPPAALMLAAAPLFGQAGKISRPIQSADRAATAAPGSIVPGLLVREVVDPATGNRWLLQRDPEHPGGPGRMVLAGTLPANSKTERHAASAQQPVAAIPVIHAGDLVMLVAHTAAMDAELEAVALAPAAAGDAFRARLKVGGSVVNAVAMGRGQAQWLPNAGDMRAEETPAGETQ